MQLPVRGTGTRTSAGAAVGAVPERTAITASCAVRGGAGRCRTAGRDVGGPAVPVVLVPIANVPLLECRIYL